MNSDIAYLQLLEDDLREAAQFERELDEEGREKAAASASAGPRRLPRRGRNWSRVAAGFVAFLVVAGGIGMLSQRHNQDSASVPGTAQGAFDQPPAAQIKPAPGDTSFGANGLRGDSVTAGGQALHAAAGSGATSDAGVSTQGKLVASQPQGDLSKIERSGDIGILVANGQFTTSEGQVTDIAVVNKGMVLSSTSQNDQSGTFTLRFPAARFDHVMNALRAIAPAGGILYQDAAGKDVTANFIDYHARLAILLKQRALLIGLQSKVHDAAQILYYANQINAVQLNVETIQGDLNFLNDSVAQSTIKVELREKDAPGATTTSVDKPSLRSAWNFALQGFLRVLGAVVIGLGYLIPIGLIALLIWGVVMLARRRRPATS